MSGLSLTAAKKQTSRVVEVQKQTNTPVSPSPPHLDFLEGDLDPVDSSEDRERRHEHRPGANLYGNAQRECDQAQIHWVTRELVGTASDKFDRRDEGKHH